MAPRRRMSPGAAHSSYGVSCTRNNEGHATSLAGPQAARLPESRAKKNMNRSTFHRPVQSPKGCPAARLGHGSSGAPCGARSPVACSDPTLARGRSTTTAII
eukprot:15275237-Alexandrium_andersonii.AAC.1